MFELNLIDLVCSLNGYSEGMKQNEEEEDNSDIPRRILRKAASRSRTRTRSGSNYGRHEAKAIPPLIRLETLDSTGKPNLPLTSGRENVLLEMDKMTPISMYVHSRANYYCMHLYDTFCVHCTRCGLPIRTP